jgi:ribosomal protein S18 acetylase RimI-like enzyme
VIRLATLDDLQAAATLIAEFRDWWGKSQPATRDILATLARLLEDADTDVLLAFADQGEPVGICQVRYRLSIWTGADDCWLEDLFVTEQARSGGHGRALVEQAIERASARGCKRVELDVNEQNQDALRFYESLGFTTEPKPPGRTLFVSRPL